MARLFSMCVFGLSFLLAAPFVQADTITELREKITERNQAIAEIEKEIAEYQQQIEEAGEEAKTLRRVIRNIDLEQKKLSAQIKVTGTRISTVTLAIQELSADIAERERRIGGNRSAIAEAIRSMSESESETLIEALLSERTLAAFWEQVDTLKRFQTSVGRDLKENEMLKAELEDARTRNEKNRSQLVSLRGELRDRTELLTQSRRAKNVLLAATKNKETEYRKLLAQKVAKRNAFEQELLQFESELRFAIDPSRLPPAGSGVLAWPLDSVKITQEFGDTGFARAGAYAGKGHNGVDFRASNGTPVKAALGGMVKGVGNTDTVCPGASYGKWVLVEHANGLSTLYAHLSLIKVSEGQGVATGEGIGYSGETGYATGPHLHFTVYATQGLRVMSRKSAVCGGTYRMPVADLKAYLNPLSYL